MTARQPRLQHGRRGAIRGPPDWLSGDAAWGASRWAVRASGIVETEADLDEALASHLRQRPLPQVLVEESLRGWKRDRIRGRAGRARQLHRGL